MNNIETKNQVQDSNDVTNCTATAGEAQFAGTVDRIFNDPEFAAQLETEPRAALENAGYTLTPAEVAALQTAKDNFTSTSDRPKVPAIVIPTSIRPLSSSERSKLAAGEK